MGAAPGAAPSPDPDVIPRLTATDAARAAIAALRADRGEAVMFVQSGGCCAGSTPMCYPLGEFLVGDVDVLVGEVDGCPFYIDTRLDAAWGTPLFVLDVAPGEPEGFSLGAGPGLRFVTTGEACAVDPATGGGAP
ncbi:MAG: DUF779 domain-containing protein [Cellulomonadaceae bacterium]|nr:DUF779 domain-containing protein [Cellulomonadaceae bacterium]